MFLDDGQQHPARPGVGLQFVDDVDVVAVGEGRSALTGGKRSGVDRVEERLGESLAVGWAAHGFDHQLPSGFQVTGDQQSEEVRRGKERVLRDDVSLE